MLSIKLQFRNSIKDNEVSMTSSEFPSSEPVNQDQDQDSGSDIEVIGYSDVEDAVVADEAEPIGSTMTECQTSELMDCLKECDRIEGKSEELKPKPVEREQESHPNSASAEAPAPEPNWPNWVYCTRKTESSKDKPIKEKPAKDETAKDTHVKDKTVVTDKTVKDKTVNPKDKNKNVKETPRMDVLEVARKWMSSFRSTLRTVLLIVMCLFMLGDVQEYLNGANHETCSISTNEQVGRWNSLQSEAKTEIFGQHIAIEGSTRALYAHIKDPDSKKGLVLSFHGWLGSGKTFLSHLIVKHMFKGGLNSPYVKSFHGPRHYLHDPLKLHEYQATLVKTIESTVRSCSRSLFIFDEVDKMPATVFNSLVPFLGHNGFIDGTDYSKATFIFISNTGGERINNLTLSHLKSGKPRSELSLHDFRQIVAEGAFNEAVGESYFTPPKAVLEYFQAFSLFLNDLQSNENVLNLKKAVAATPMWKALKSSYQGFIGPQIDTTSQEGQGGLFQSELITRRLVDHYIPFLPLEREHVILCARREIKRRNALYIKPEEIVDRLLFFPKGNAVFAEEGCKNIGAHVAYYVHDSSDF